MKPGGSPVKRAGTLTVYTLSLTAYENLKASQDKAHKFEQCGWRRALVLIANWGRKLSLETGETRRRIRKMPKERLSSGVWFHIVEHLFSTCRLTTSFSLLASCLKNHRTASATKLLRQKAPTQLQATSRSRWPFISICAIKANCKSRNYVIIIVNSARSLLAFSFWALQAFVLSD